MARSARCSAISGWAYSLQVLLGLARLASYGKEATDAKR